ncbi:MAG: YkvA family protein [Chloroflexota bacterium]
MRLFKEMFIILLGILAFLYLINPTAGVLEFIPDNLPIIGNIDEGFATAVLLGVMRYYGLDITRLFGRKSTTQPINLGQRNTQNQQGYANVNTQPTDAQYQRLQQEEAQRNRKI